MSDQPTTTWWTVARRAASCAVGIFDCSYWQDGGNAHRQASAFDRTGGRIPSAPWLERVTTIFVGCSSAKPPNTTALQNCCAHVAELRCRSMGSVVSV